MEKVLKLFNRKEGVRSLAGGKWCLLEKAGTGRWRWPATTACLLQGQVVLRWRRLRKEHSQRQKFRQRATQRLTSREQKILVLRFEAGIPERAKEENEGKITYSGFSCLCNYFSIFFPSPSSQAGSICSLCSVLEFLSLPPFDFASWCPLKLFLPNSQRISSLSPPVLYTSLYPLNNLLHQGAMFVNTI